MNPLPPAGRAVRIHRDGYSPVTFPLDPARRYDFGRAARARILFDDRRVSRIHGRLECVEHRWVFVDAGSANGSYRFLVRDWIDCEAVGAHLPCARLEEGRREWLRPGEGILLGSREAWLELLLEIPVGAVLDPDRINPPGLRARLGIDKPTYDLDPELTAQILGRKAG